MNKKEAQYILEALDSYWKDHSGDLQGPAHAERREALIKARASLTEIAAHGPEPIPEQEDAA